LTAKIIFSCDGERPDMGCRAFYPTRSIVYEAAWREAQEHGWTLAFHGGRFKHYCPSRGHEEGQS
jgi:hypothetical protein